jgi:hypothetical protein
MPEVSSSAAVPKAAGSLAASSSASSLPMPEVSLLDQLITVNPYATPPSREDLRRSSAVGSTETPSESTPAPTMRRGLDGEGSTPVPKLPPMPTVRGSRTKAAAPYPVAPLLRISVLLLRDGFLCIKLWLPFLLGT